jgi:probable LLM family oxidoreductase
MLEFGLHTFGDVTLNPDGTRKSHATVLRDVLVEAQTADAAGIDSFDVGEHHRDDFAISAPEVVLAAIASRTSRIRLGTAVTVLSTDDPVRVYERFATLDGLSNGRAEVILGRGSFTESYPLFGYSLENYEVLFEEKLELFAKLREEGAVSWTGTMRSGLKDQRVFPPAEKKPIPTWVGVGGSPESVVRAARYGMPLMLAIIGGSAARFKPYVDLYREACEQLGKGVLPVAVHSPGHVAETDAAATEEYWKAFKGMHDRIGAERGWPPMTRRAFESEVEGGAMYVGSPETVVKKISQTVKDLGLSRFDLKYSAGTLSHEAMIKSIELFGRDVVPRVRAERE